MSQPSKPFDVSRPGKVIAGRYAVERVLGMGGMGMVIIAQHLDLGQRVVLKLLRPEVTQDSDVVTRFLREARATAGIQSEHVVRVFDVARLEDGTPYMVMEYLDGADLDRVLRSRGPLPISEVADYILQACEAVAEAHARGIVHRDIKPANLFLTQRSDGTPLVKVLDFGISKFTGSVGPEIGNSLTSTSDVLGSPQYMSPEQIRSSKTVDSRTDVWALGVLLHRLLTKRQPFEAPTLGLVISNILNEPPTSLRDHRPDAPPELEELILGCLEKDVTLRYQSVADLARGLIPFAPARAVISFERIVRILRGVGVIVARIAPSKDMPSERPPASTRSLEASSPPRPLSEITRTELMPAASDSEASTRSLEASSPPRPLSEITHTELMPAASDSEAPNSRSAGAREERAYHSSGKLNRGALLRPASLSGGSSSPPAPSSIPPARISSSSSSPRASGPSPASHRPTIKSQRPPAPSPRVSSLPVIIGGLAFGATVSVGLYAVLTFYGGSSKGTTSAAPSVSALQKDPAPSTAIHMAPSSRLPQVRASASGAPPVETSASAPPVETSATSARPKAPHGRR